MSQRGLLVVVSVLGLSAPALTRAPAASQERDMIKNSIGMTLKLIPAGSFLMGAAPDDAGAGGDQKPQHKVTITRPFSLGVYEVTQHEYTQVMGTNPSGFQFGKDSKRLPVEKVSWFDAVTFCNKLSEREGRRPYYKIDDRTVMILGGNGYRLPTEAEWEYACRAPKGPGDVTKHPFGNDESDLEKYAWHLGNSNAETHPVGQKKPNRWGLYDMQGNVWEWCQDAYSEVFYKSSPDTDPIGPAAEKASARVIRGGSCVYPARVCPSAHREWLEPGDRIHDSLGFRVAAAQE